MTKTNTLVVFGGGNWLQNTEYWDLAYSIGRTAAEHGFTVCTGGYLGVMEAASKGAVSREGKSLGILHTSPEIKKPNQFLTDIIIADDYLDRLARLMRFSYSIALPGGSGTLAEITVALALLNRYDNKRLAIWEPFWKEALSPLIRDNNVDPMWINNIDVFSNWLHQLKEEQKIDKK